jgi:hypothetical protein
MRTPGRDTPGFCCTGYGPAADTFRGGVSPSGSAPVSPRAPAPRQGAFCFSYAAPGMRRPMMEHGRAHPPAREAPGSGDRALLHEKPPVAEPGGFSLRPPRAAPRRALARGCRVRGLGVNVPRPAGPGASLRCRPGRAKGRGECRRAGRPWQRAAPGGIFGHASAAVPSLPIAPGQPQPLQALPGLPAVALRPSAARGAADPA